MKTAWPPSVHCARCRHTHVLPDGCPVETERFQAECIGKTVRVSDFAPELLPEGSDVCVVGHIDRQDPEKVWADARWIAAALNAYEHEQVSA